MDTVFLFAGTRFGVQSERMLLIDPVLQKFIATSRTNDADILIKVCWNWDSLSWPDLTLLGEDLICRYYRHGEKQYCFGKGKINEPLSCAIYDDDCNEILVVVNGIPFQHPLNDLSSILRLIPMRMIFQRFNVLFLHAAQICYLGRGILFTAPSGTGKTTQAKLWNQFRDAEIICNDRTLLRKTENTWNTYGYPIDGSEPVQSDQVNLLGAIVILAQGPDNQIQRLRPGKAIGLLMRQMIFDCWSVEARTTAMNQLLLLLEDIPVYLLSCTPDERAVTVLERKLREDGVLSDE